MKLLKNTPKEKNLPDYQHVGDGQTKSRAKKFEEFGARRIKFRL